MHIRTAQLCYSYYAFSSVVYAPSLCFQKATTKMETALTKTALGVCHERTMTPATCSACSTDERCVNSPASVLVQNCGKTSPTAVSAHTFVGRGAVLLATKVTSKNSDGRGQGRIYGTGFGLCAVESSDFKFVSYVYFQPTVILVFRIRCI